MSYVAGDALPESLSITVPLSRYTSMFMAQKRHSRRIGVSHSSFWGMTGPLLALEPPSQVYSVTLSDADMDSRVACEGRPLRQDICALTCPIETSSLQSRTTAALALVGKIQGLESKP